jgi:hypothetical protein
MLLGTATTLFARIEVPRSVISVCSASTSSEVMLATSRERQRGCSHYSTIAFVIAPAALRLRYQRFISAGRTRADVCLRLRCLVEMVDHSKDQYLL